RRDSNPHSMASKTIPSPGLGYVARKIPGAGQSPHALRTASKASLHLRRRAAAVAAPSPRIAIVPDVLRGGFEPPPPRPSTWCDYQLRHLSIAPGSSPGAVLTL